ncbi:SCA7, zinc-binding domain-domain-containing protein [Absidia repens]|uniref:SCA7, zinc-binding domain-domain-containing protein n=1 Tax=Absidia repens TaxID=90262 RepID=A0A1X2ILL3_9FUNG|nr:SCA7, zinc-binding domain-domain-containing protein [Absidia repens]
MSTNGTLKKHETLSDEQQSILKQKSGKIERLETDITNLSRPLLGDDSKDKGWVKHVTPGVLSIFQDDSSWNKLTIKPGDPLLKQQHSQELQKATGSSWKKVKDVLNADMLDGKGDDATTDGEPATTKLNYRDMKTYGNLPMEDEIAVVNCDSCQRPILASSFKDHLDNCVKKGSNSNSNKGNRKNATNGNGDNNKKKVSNQGFFSENDDDDDDDDDDHMGTTKQNNKDVSLVKKKKKIAKPSSNMTDDDTSNSNNNNINSSTNSKRPPSNVAEKGDKKKVKKEKAKAKGAKQKAPLDLDKQCGVIQQPNGLPCTRSLTCKSHSMGAKRAVAGRSQPYDVLLAAYQKKAIGRPQAGAIGGMIGKNAKLKKQHSSSPAPSSGSNLNNNGGNSSMNINNGNAASASSSSATAAAGSGTTANDDYFDSDEEVENVMQALRSNHPAPLAQKPYFYVKRQRKCFRLRDILLEAITPKTNSIDSIQHNPTSTQANGNTSLMSAPSPSSFSGTSATTSLLPSQNDFNFYQQQKSYPFQQDGGNGIVPRNISLQQQQQRSSLSSSPSPSPVSGTIGYPGIYNSTSMDGLSPSPSTSSVVSTYSIR